MPLYALNHAWGFHACFSGHPGVLLDASWDELSILTHAYPGASFIKVSTRVEGMNWCWQRRVEAPPRMDLLAQMLLVDARLLPAEFAVNFGKQSKAEVDACLLPQSKAVRVRVIRLLSRARPIPFPAETPCARTYWMAIESLINPHAPAMGWIGSAPETISIDAAIVAPLDTWPGLHQGCFASAMLPSLNRLGHDLFRSLPAPPLVVLVEVCPILGCDALSLLRQNYDSLVRRSLRMDQLLLLPWLRHVCWKARLHLHYESSLWSTTLKYCCKLVRSIPDVLRLLLLLECFLCASLILMSS
jgi:hypothetical protein